MSSTDLDAPPLKSLLLAIVAVVGLHVLAAIALVAIKTPELKPEPKKEMSPLEIKFVSLPAKTVSTEVEKQTVTAKKEVQPEVQVQPAPQPAPILPDHSYRYCARHGKYPIQYQTSQ